MVISQEHTVIDEHHKLGAELLQRALDGTDHPGHAASVLVSAAATILERLYGHEVAIETLHHALDRAGAAWRHQHAN